jgi:hypothetical protein
MQSHSSNPGIPANRSPTAAEPDDGSENVVTRLRNRIRDTKRMGIRVRSEWLDDQQATWCEIGGVLTVFVDLSQPAAEQLAQLEEALQSLAGRSLAGPLHRASEADRAAA